MPDPPELRGNPRGNLSGKMAVDSSKLLPFPSSPQDEESSCLSEALSNITVHVDSYAEEMIRNICTVDNVGTRNVSG